MAMQEYVDYFDLMPYDMYGVWDKDNKWTGPDLKGHTDWNTLEIGLGLLWRNGIKTDKIVVGFGFYGRSFTMEDVGCTRPDGKCRFSRGGNAESCSATEGILTFAEIAGRNTSLDVATYYDKASTVKYNIFGRRSRYG